MKPYLATLSARFRVLLQYRGAAIAGAATQVFWGFVRVTIFLAFYKSSSGGQPMTLQETTGYLWLSQAFLAMTMTGADSELAAMIRTGNVAYELVRPVDLYSYWLARSFSGRAAPMLLRVGPILIVGALVGQLHAPPTVTHAVLFLMSIALGLMLAVVMFVVVTISMLWTISGEGAARLAPPVVFFLSGMIVPLPFFPEFLQPVIRAMPFRGIIDVPFRIYLGQLGQREILIGFIQQMIWIGAFVILGRMLLGRGLKKLVANGG